MLPASSMHTWGLRGSFVCVIAHVVSVRRFFFFGMARNISSWIVLEHRYAASMECGWLLDRSDPSVHLEFERLQLEAGGNKLRHGTSFRWSACFFFKKDSISWRCTVVGAAARPWQSECRAQQCRVNLSFFQLQCSFASRQTYHTMLLV